MANREQVDRFREVPDGADFYAPVTGLFRADPTRTDDPVLDVLLGLVRAGRDLAGHRGGCRPVRAADRARPSTPSGGSVIALDPSVGMLEALREIADELRHRRTSASSRPLAAATDVGARSRQTSSLIAHVGYDIEAIGPFLGAMEAATRRRCVAVLMERQPSSIADVCWPPVHGEARVALPALPEFVELLRAMGRDPEVHRLEREPRRFGDRAELEGFLRRQLWVEPGSDKDARFREALDGLVEADADGRIGLRGQRPLPTGIVTWAPDGGR